MKLVRSLAAAAASFAVLASVGSAPAKAADFTLSGKFAPTANAGTTGLTVQLQNGSFDGTYSYSGDAVPVQNLSTVPSFLINLRDASNNILTTFDSALGHTGTITGQYGGPGTTDILLFQTPGPSIFTPGASLYLSFPPDYRGIGDFIPSFETTFFDVFDNSTLNIISATSAPASATPVPEPLTVGGTLVAAGMGMALKKKAAAQKVSQKA